VLFRDNSQFVSQFPALLYRRVEYPKPMFAFEFRKITFNLAIPHREAESASSDTPLQCGRHRCKPFKVVRGNGKRKVAYFADPNCGYCKKFEQELMNAKDVTIHVVLFPILSPDSADKARAVWCSKDKAKAWNDWMVNNSAPAAGKCDASAVEKTVTLGQKFGIRGTPTIFFTDGNRVPGYMPVAQLEKAIAAAGK
jgi:thioredoxin-related protein